MESLLLGFMREERLRFLIVNFPFLSTNIPLAPAYIDFVSQLARYNRACCKYQDIVDRGKLLTNTFLSTVKSSMENTMISLIPTMWPFLNLFLI